MRRHQTANSYDCGATLLDICPFSTLSSSQLIAIVQSWILCILNYFKTISAMVPEYFGPPSIALSSSRILILSREISRLRHGLSAIAKISITLRLLSCISVPTFSPKDGNNSPRRPHYRRSPPWSVQLQKIQALTSLGLFWTTDKTPHRDKWGRLRSDVSRASQCGILLQSYWHHKWYHNLNTSRCGRLDHKPKMTSNCSFSLHDNVQNNSCACMVMWGLISTFLYSNWWHINDFMRPEDIQDRTFAQCYRPHHLIMPPPYLLTPHLHPILGSSDRTIVVSTLKTLNILPSLSQLTKYNFAHQILVHLRPS